MADYQLPKEEHYPLQLLQQALCSSAHHDLGNQRMIRDGSAKELIRNQG
jgi:hypothetical protein